MGERERERKGGSERVKERESAIIILNHEIGFM